MDTSTSELDLHVNEIVNNAELIIDNFGARTPGSEGEKNALKYLQDQFSPIVDKNNMENFSVNPKLFMGFVNYCMILDLIAIGFYWFVPGAAFAFSLIGFLMFFLGGWNYLLIFDPFFPKLTSHNLISKKNPKSPS